MTCFAVSTSFVARPRPNTQIENATQNTNKGRTDFLATIPRAYREQRIRETCFSTKPLRITTAPLSPSLITQTCEGTTTLRPRHRAALHLSLQTYERSCSCV